MIAVNDVGEILCDYHDCLYYDSGMCSGGLYQCPHNIERAKVCLPEAIKDYEDLKSQEPYGEEYYMDLSELERRVNTYKRLTEQ